MMNSHSEQIESGEYQRVNLAGIYFWAIKCQDALWFDLHEARLTFGYQYSSKFVSVESKTFQIRACDGTTYERVFVKKEGLLALLNNVVNKLQAIRNVLEAV